MTQTLTRPATVSPPPPAPPRRKKHRDPSRYFRLHLPLVLYLLFTLIPFYWMLVFAFRPTGETTLVPWPITFEHFDTVWNGIGFGLFFQNSLIIGVGTLVVVTVFALMGGYALARFKFRGQRVFLLALLCTQFIPGAMMLIPLFVIFKSAGLLNSLTGLIIADTGYRSVGFGSEIVTRVVEQAFKSLKCPPCRITLPDFPTPTSPALSAHYYPTAVNIMSAIRSMLGLNGPFKGPHESRVMHDVPDLSFAGPF